MIHLSFNLQGMRRWYTNKKPEPDSLKNCWKETDAATINFLS